MELNDIINLGASAFKGKLDLNGDGKVDLSEAGGALKALLSNEQGEFDLAYVIEKMKSSGLVSMAESWLGDGKNDAVRPGQVADIFGKDKIAAFAEKLGIREISALNGLSEALPKLVDKSSSGGSLLSMGQDLLASVGGVDGVVDLAKKMLGSEPEEKAASENTTTAA
jgi:uncharacterized protein YidB (DUF937 family)